MNYIKQILVIGVVTLSVVSCAQKVSTNGFEVSGKIEGLKNEKVLLQQIPFNAQIPVVVDSTTTSGTGEFKLKSGSTEEGLYRIVGGTMFPVLLVNDNNNIKVNYNPQQPAKPKIEGSDATIKLYDFLHGYQAKDSVLETAAHMADSLNNSPGSSKVKDSTIAALKTKAQSAADDMNSYVKSFIQQSSDPGAIYFALMLGTQSLAPKELLTLVNGACLFSSA